MAKQSKSEQIKKALKEAAKEILGAKNAKDALSQTVTGKGGR